MPAIVRFLGYVPFGHNGSLGDKIRWLRVTAGLAQDDWSKAARIAPGTIGRWEQGRGMLGSSLIGAAIKILSEKLEAAELKAFVTAELTSVQTAISVGAKRAI